MVLPRETIAVASISAFFFELHAVMGIICTVAVLRQGVERGNYYSLLSIIFFLIFSVFSMVFVEVIGRGFMEVLFYSLLFIVFSAVVNFSRAPIDSLAASLCDDGFMKPLSSFDRALIFSTGIMMLFVASFLVAFSELGYSSYSEGAFAFLSLFVFLGLFQMNASSRQITGQFKSLRKLIDGVA